MLIINNTSAQGGATNSGSRLKTKTPTPIRPQPAPVGDKSQAIHPMAGNPLFGSKNIVANDQDCVQKLISTRCCLAFAGILTAAWLCLKKAFSKTPPPKLPPNSSSQSRQPATHDAQASQLSLSLPVTHASQSIQPDTDSRVSHLSPPSEVMIDLERQQPELVSDRPASPTVHSVQPFQQPPTQGATVITDGPDSLELPELIMHSEEPPSPKRSHPSSDPDAEWSAEQDDWTVLDEDEKKLQ